MKSTGCSVFSILIHKQHNTCIRTDLQDGERAAVFGDPPPVRTRDVAQPRRRDALHVEPRVLAEVLDHLRAADSGLAEVAQEDPQAELQRDPVRVRRAAELLRDEGVVRVVRLLLCAQGVSGRRG